MRSCARSRKRAATPTSRGPSPSASGFSCIRCRRLGSAGDAFVDAGTLFDAALPYDQRFFESLTGSCRPSLGSAGPGDDRRAQVDRHREGQAFAPDAKTAETLTLGAGEAHAWLAQRFESAYPWFYPEGPGDSGARWFFPADEQMTRSVAAYFETENAYPIDARATVYYCAFSSIRHIGAGQFYLFATRDGRGASLDGGSPFAWSCRPTYLSGSTGRPPRTTARPTR